MLKYKSGPLIFLKDPPNVLKICKILNSKDHSKVSCSRNNNSKFLDGSALCIKNFKLDLSYRDADSNPRLLNDKRSSYLCPKSSTRYSLRSEARPRPPSGMYHSLTVQSSEALATMLSLKGFHLISKTGRLCPETFKEK